MAYLPWSDLPPSEDLTLLEDSKAAEAVHTVTLVNWLRAQDDVRFLERALAEAKADERAIAKHYEATLDLVQRTGGSPHTALQRAMDARQMLGDYDLRDGITQTPTPVAKSTPKPTKTSKPKRGEAHLSYHHTVEVIPGERSFHDNRHRVTKTITSYRDMQGQEYRKTYETKSPHEANIIREGYNSEINRNLRQW